MMDAIFVVTEGKYISNARGLKEEKIVKAAKTILFEETDKFVTPIREAELGDDEIVRHCESMISDHVERCTTSVRMVKQRHVLYAVPMVVVFFMHDKKKGSFFVYGEDREIFFPSYPDKCCIL